MIPLVSVIFHTRDDPDKPVGVRIKFNPNGKRNKIFKYKFKINGEVLTIETKKCPVCNNTYKLTEYSINRSRWDGRAYSCVDCTKESTEKKKKKTETRRGTDEGYAFETTEDGEKGIRCKTCNTVKDLSEYHRNSHSLSGYRPSCKSCTLKQMDGASSSRTIIGDNDI